LGFGIDFAPLVPAYVLWAGAAVAVVVIALLLLARSRGVLIRALALALIVLALANPSFTKQDRELLSSVAVVVVDKSPSQNFGERARQTEEARAALNDRLSRIPGLEVRVVEAGQADGETDGTRLFHDERDRRVVLTSAPRFGIVGQSQIIAFRVEDQGVRPGRARVTVRRNGEAIENRVVNTNAPLRTNVPIPHAGPNIVEIEASPLEDELTPVNNRAVVSIDGVRDKLRVLLVSGEPHAGERTWRNLLKSDASVDLVHFTILRPPEKQDGTPINELSLIAFPTRELFQQKIGEFHLIIFDRYARQGVLPIIYFDNIARYVREGGAVLVAAGPDYASPTSLWRTPLDTILPAEPAGTMTEQAFRARLTELGKRHPVTRELEGSQSDPPHWSRWFRVVDAKVGQGSAIMEGPDGKPLLVLSREGEGRVALLLSDHIWLWARGFEGGGPHLDLLRKLSHWLMKQPDLEEEALRLVARGRDLTIERQTMAESVEPVTVTTPSGETRSITLQVAEPGLWRGTTPANELGLWRATDGKLTTLVNVGPVNPREFSEVTSSIDVLKPLSEATGGDARRLDDNGSLRMPRIVGVRSSETFKGDDWMGVKLRDASVVRGIGVLPVFAGFLGLLLLVGSLAATWAREGR
jgi:hypothetical protein